MKSVAKSLTTDFHYITAEKQINRKQHISISVMTVFRFLFRKKSNKNSLPIFCPILRMGILQPNLLSKKILNRKTANRGFSVLTFCWVTQLCTQVEYNHVSFKQNSRKRCFCKIKKHVPEAITKYYSQNIPSALWILFDSHIHDFQLNIKVKSCSLLHACAVGKFRYLMTSLLWSRDDHVI